MQKAHLKFLRVLFVEDDEMQRQELSDYLKRRVGKIYFAKNGEEGLEKYKQCAPNIVICDIRMPKMDGLKMVSIFENLVINDSHHYANGTIRQGIYSGSGRFRGYQLPHQTSGSQ